MSLTLFSDKDLRRISKRGIDIQEGLKQLEIFRRGTAPVRLFKPACTGDGIVQMPPDQRKNLISLHDQAAKKGRMVKFVPASGAASRMFKDWLNWHQQKKADSLEQTSLFFESLSKYPFYDDLKKIMASEGEETEACIREERITDILDTILTPKGMNYAWLPKALLKFHIYPDHIRTAMEEHLVEAALYVRDAKKICRIHFTVSEEHESRFKELLSRVKGRYEKRFRVKYKITITRQHPSTDTIAVDMENNPFHDREGMIVFRPGGHGALLKDLNAIRGDIIFIKNIDNIVPDRLKESTVLHKKILGGYLVQLQKEIFHYLKLLSKKKIDEELLSQAVRFCRDKLFIFFPEVFHQSSISDRKKYLFRLLNRPIRVCGMVKNEGEPGGGPFWVEENETRSLQIVEQSQIDINSEEQNKIWNSSTHFNPVDLVCGVRDYQGKKFNLNRYVNKEAVFISKKSYEGKEIKSLELPGLWNGSMAYWITVFVEVPIETFNPVKTVEDLLREPHLP